MNKQQIVLNTLKRIKRAERATETVIRRVIKGQNTNSEAISTNTPEAYIHPWSEQNLGSPKIVDQIQKQHCCGCGSCMNTCPTGAIVMAEDEEGFLYPSVNHNACIDCSACVRHCPSYCDQPTNWKQKTCFATIVADDAIRLRSSSGGLFSQLAEIAFNRNGVVFGAAYEGPDTVCHKAVECREDLDILRRSKYVQSSTGATYTEVKDLLEDGRFVLYSGCPCHIAGLYAYLGNDDTNLLTVDLICHGSPSPGLFRRYIRETYGEGVVKEINFRDKAAFGWSTHMNAYLSNGSIYRELCTNDPYYLMFLRCMAMRPFCSLCKFTRLPRVADLSIGDWWGIEKFDPTLNDKKGTSLLIVNNEKGEKAFESIRADMQRCEKFSLDMARPRNYTIDRPFKAHSARKRFFSLLEFQPFDKAVRYAHNWHYDVGIFGLWYGENYGSMLTYYGLRKVVESMGLSCVMIENPLLIKNRDFSLEPHRFAQRQNYYLTKHRTLDKMSGLNEVCDTFLLGSDQLWNPGLSRPYGLSYFLEFVGPKNKRVAYGTSFGKDTHTTEDVYRERSLLELMKFDAVSVRDEFSKEILSVEYGCMDVQKVLDPALLCDPCHYEELALQAESVCEVVSNSANYHNSFSFDTQSREYYFAYILDPDENMGDSLSKIARISDKEILCALDYAPRRQKKLYELLCNTVNSEVHIMHMPTCEQWLRAIRDSSGVLTDSFHGTIFAYVFNRNFVSVPNQIRGRKRFSDLLSLLALDDRTIDNIAGNEERICSMLATDADVTYSRSLLKQQREQSLHWLNDALFSPKTAPVDRAYIRQESRRDPALRQAKA